MFQLIYASTATRRLEEAELRELIERARARNTERGVTGVLVHRNGSFLHVIEGAEEEARALYQRICEDGRHQWVTLLKAAPVQQRDFPDAPLAFRDRSEAGARRPERDLFGGRDASHETSHETLLQFQRANARADAAPGGPDLSSHGSASGAAAS